MNIQSIMRVTFKIRMIYDFILEYNYLVHNIGHDSNNNHRV